MELILYKIKLNLFITKYYYLCGWMLSLAFTLTEVKAKLILPRPIYSIFNPNGALDIANCELVSGWALDQSDMNQTVTVDIYVDGNLVGSTQANTDRQDLVGAFGNSAARYHGFSYSVPANASWRNGQGHSVAVRIRGASTDVMSSPKTVNGCSGGTTNPLSGNCAFSDGQFLLNWSGEQIYAHYYNGILYAAYQNGTSGFKPRNWLSNTGYDASKLACFAENDPHSNTTTTNPTTPTNPARGNFAGSLDFADCSGIGGWIMDQNMPNKSIKFDVYVNGWLVATNVMAIRSRQDVANAYGISGYNKFGFNVPVPKMYNVGLALTISVKYAGTNTEIPGSPKTTAVCPDHHITYVDPDCYTQIARFFPGSEPTNSITIAHTGATSLKLSRKALGSIATLASKLIPVKQGDNLLLDVYAFAPASTKRSITPKLTSAIVGGVVAGMSLTKHQTTAQDKGRIVSTLPTIGLSAALILPMAKELLSNRLPNATAELAFYDKAGKFIHRQQVSITKKARTDWQLLSIVLRVPQDGYVMARLRNQDPTPVYFDDIVLKTNPKLTKGVESTKSWSTKVLSSSNGFSTRQATDEQNVYQTGLDDNCGGGAGNGYYGTIVENYYIDPSNGILLEIVDVRDQAPVYTYANGNIVAGGSNGGINILPGLNLNDKFNQQLKQTKEHFCQQAANIIAKYSTSPGWAGPNDPTNAIAGEILGDFIRDVKGGATYDLKVDGHGYSIREIGPISNYAGGILRNDDYGNINFGLAAAASGIPLSIALCGAGLYQLLPNSGPVDLRNVVGCFDDSQDSAFIIMGYQMFNGCENAVNNGNN
ncbi:hypothetical protein GCM10028819_52830 [Spirosoma humi]